MSDDSPVKDYFQLGNGEPADSYEPGDNKQKIDLTEYYKETGQDNATVMVMGAEAFSLGRVSREIALKLKLEGARNYDPFPSERNAVTGNEGFLSSVADGFKAFIEGIIKYIRMAIDWVVDTVKGIFGYRKSARITKAIDDKLDDMNVEFQKTLTGLGFPAKEYNVENFIGDLPAGKNRLTQVTLLKNKLVKDEDSIKNLTNALPIFQQTVAKITKISNQVSIASKNLKRVISEEHKRTLVRAHNFNLVEARESPEVNRVTKACAETSAALNIEEVAGSVQALYAILYKIDFTNEELSGGFAQVREKLQATIVAQATELNASNIAQTMADIQYLNKRYQEISDNEIDLSRVNWKEIGTIVDKGDAAKIGDISRHFNRPVLITTYQQTTVDLRNFTNFCYSVSSELLKVQNQAAMLIEWHNRAQAYYVSGVVGDIDKCIKLCKEARAAGHSPLANRHGEPVGGVFIKEADAQTFMEKASADVNFIVESDIAGLKTTANNFSKQIGWGKMI